jgi:hypothetical protein
MASGCFQKYPTHQKPQVLRAPVARKPNFATFSQIISTPAKLLRDPVVFLGETALAAYRINSTPPSPSTQDRRTMAEATVPKPSSSVKLVLLGEAAVGKVC